MTALLSLLLVQPGSTFDSVRPLEPYFGRNTNLLVIAPHPDDEAIGAAGLIQRVIASAGAVRVVLMTSGDAYPEGLQAETHIRRPGPKDFRNYGSIRERETIAAMAQLGVGRSNLMFLGFPDEGMCFIASQRGLSRLRAFESMYTGRYEPPVSDQVVRGVEYRDADVRKELQLIVSAFHPTVVALPTPNDDHPDHGASGILAREALDNATRGGRPAPVILEYLVHYQQWPDLGEDRSLPLAPPADFKLVSGEWRSLALSERETEGKRRALEAYPSQQLVIGPFLKAFGRPNELFLAGRTDARTECWCDATHVATEAIPGRHRHLVPRP